MSIKIATHNGSFHADDVFAVAMLYLMYPDKEIFVIRSRDHQVLSACHFVVDVGQIHDPLRGLFDHHQTGGAGLRVNGVPYASSGLIWGYFGEQLCGSKAIAEKIDDLIIQKLDAADCGYSARGLDRTYSAIIADFNPKWNDANADYDAAFADAVHLARTILSNAIGQEISDAQAGDAIGSARSEGAILILDKYVPWREAVVKSMPGIRFVVFPDPVGSWKVQAAPVCLSRFESRALFPASWGGLSNNGMDAVTGVVDCVFCHINLFIAGNKTQHGAIELARKALNS